MLSVESIIELYGMSPLEVEGGYFVETYRAGENVDVGGLPDRYVGGRDFSTAILYLLPAGQCSRLHRVKSDEIFHFYLGDAVEMVQLLDDGMCKKITLGSDITAGEMVQVIVPAGTWQGAYVRQGGKFALMGCTVAPGFEFEDFEIGEKNKLLGQYPEAQEVIERLT